MKKIFSLLVIALGFALLSSCSDDDEPAVKNTLTINGTAHDLEQAYVTPYPWDDTHTYYDLIFSKGVSLADKGTYDTFEGTGKIFLIGIKLPSTDTSLPAGSYTLNADRSDAIQYLYLVDIANGRWSETNLHNLGFESDGPLTVSKSGSNYTIKGSFKKGTDIYSVSYNGTVAPARIAS